MLQKLGSLNLKILAWVGAARKHLMIVFRVLCVCESRGVLLPVEQRKRVNWTSSSTFMRLDGILKAFCESRKQPLKSHSYLPAIGADVREVTPAKAAGRLHCSSSETASFTIVYLASS